MSKRSHGLPPAKDRAAFSRSASKTKLINVQNVFRGGVRL